MNKTFQVTEQSLDQLEWWAKLHLKGGEYVLTYTTVAKAKTEAQNNTFHDLLDIYWKSGEATKKYSCYKQMRTKFVIEDAKLVKEYIYHDGEKFVVVEKFVDVPMEYILSKQVIKRPDSWSKVTRKNAIKAIDALIKEMLAMDVSGIKFDKMILAFNGRDW